MRTNEDRIKSLDERIKKLDECIESTDKFLKSCEKLDKLMMFVSFIALATGIFFIAALIYAY